MAKTANLYARIEPEIKGEAEKILEALGIPVSVAINLFYKQIILQQGLPFNVSLNPAKSNETATTLANAAATQSNFAKTRPQICSEPQTAYNANVNLKNYSLTSTEEPSDELLEALMNQVGEAAKKSSANAELTIKKLQDKANSIIAKNKISCYKTRHRRA